MRYPFCVLDVDGTLTFAYDEYHPAVLAPLQRYRESGGVVALLSGRLPSGMRAAARFLGLSDGVWLGGGDGAVGGRLRADGSIEWHWQGSLDVHALLPHLRKAGEPGVALAPDRVIAVGAVNKVMERMAAITSPDMTRIPSWDGFMQALAGEPLCGLRFILERKQTERLIAILSQSPEGEREIFDNAEFTSRHVGYSIRPAGFNKGTALSRLAQAAGFEPAQTAAFGDWITDIPMLRAAGYSCAPADALEAVRMAATRVSSRTIRDGWLAHEIPALQQDA